MSCHYGLRCISCDASSPHTFNHGQDIVRDIVRCAPLIKYLHDLQRSGYLEIRFMADDGVLNFALAHYSHTLVLEDEYTKTVPL